MHDCFSDCLDCFLVTINKGNLTSGQPGQNSNEHDAVSLSLPPLFPLRSSAVHCHSTFIPACSCDLLHWFHNLSFSEKQFASSNLAAVAFKCTTSDGVFSAHFCPRNWASFPSLHSLYRLLLLVSEILSKTTRSTLLPTSSSFITAPSSPLVQT